MRLVYKRLMFCWWAWCVEWMRHLRWLVYFLNFDDWFSILVGPLLFLCCWILSRRYEDALRLGLFCFTRVFKRFDPRFHPFVLRMDGTMSIFVSWGYGGFTLWALGVFARVLNCFDRYVHPYLKGRWGLLFVSSWRFVRLLTCFDLHVRPYLKGGWGLLFVSP